jgi:hypothetical protein
LSIQRNVLTPIQVTLMRRIKGRGRPINATPPGDVDNTSDVLLAQDAVLAISKNSKAITETS